ncbi:MAG TPA: hypothetical protein VKG20_05960 [Methylomirabilota bacterium]|nr:hypothetical protein [Methylomirabilota bacterium]
MLAPDLPTEPATIAQVLEAELQEIEARRHRQYASHEEAAPEKAAPAARTAECLVGLALSGGGIRSATFSLGVLQGLESLKLLRVFDYMSTVSGGGFVGGWWSAWLSRHIFGPRHIKDPQRLATALEKEPPRKKLLAAARQKAATATAAERADANRMLVNLLVRELNDLAEGPSLKPGGARHGDAAQTSIVVRRKENYRWLIQKYPNELQDPTLPTIFPELEEIEQERADAYRDDRVPDGALAAGVDPIHHLRLFSNYLTPRKGLASADTWRAIGVVARNLLLTWLVLVPILLGVILLGQLYFVGLDPSMLNPIAAPTTELLLQRAVFVLPWVLVPAWWLLFLTFMWMHFNNAGTSWTHLTNWIVLVIMAGGLALFVADVRGTCVGIPDCLGSLLASNRRPPELPLVIAGGLLLVGTIALWLQVVRISGVGFFERKAARQKQIQSNQATRWQGAVLMLWVSATSALLLAGFSGDGVALLLDSPNFGQRAVALVTTVATMAGAVFTAIKASPVGGAESKALDVPGRASQVVFAVTPTLVLFLLMVSGSWVMQKALRLIGGAEGAESRLTVLTIEVFAGLGLCLVFAGFEAAERGGVLLAAAMVVCVGSAATAFVFVLRGLVFGQQASSVFSWAAGSADLYWAFAAQMAGWALVLVIGLLRQRRQDGRLLCLGVFALVALMSLLFVATRLGAAFPSRELDISRWYGLYAVVGLTTFLGCWAVALGWMADPNALSLHTFYRSRLVRAYLGASNWSRNRSTKEITDAVAGDDIRLSDLENCSQGGAYHLVNTTLNLVGGRDLSTAQRSAAAFLMSKAYCGSVRTGYRRTQAYMDDAMTLGAAVAASGAAVSPNMGSRTPTAALAMLLTLMNVRLGFWAPAPHRHHWRYPQARLWPWYLLKESLSQTTTLSSYCYLTDGGHFDNTGLYALIERGCRFIVLADNGADAEPSFEDLGEAIRRCRIDFGTEIEIDVSGFRKTDGFTLDLPGDGATADIRKSSGPAASRHHVVGKITYSEAHAAELKWQGDDRIGVLVWLKPALLGHEPADVRQYGFGNPVFPQQSTADQWFDEAQFESYRKLGFFTAVSAFGPTLTELQSPILVSDQPLRTMEIERLFQRLQNGPSVSLEAAAFRETRR